MMRANGAALEVPVQTIIAAIREPADFLGLPFREDGATAYAPPKWAKKLADEGKGILFLDEVSAAPPSVQNALLRVILERVVGDDLQLPEGVMICAAANPAEQLIGGWNLSAPLANRFVHFDWTMKSDDWTAGMRNGWPRPKITRLPEGWSERFKITSALYKIAIVRSKLTSPRKRLRVGVSGRSNPCSEQ
jgi:hypothetical protein